MLFPIDGARETKTAAESPGGRSALDLRHGGENLHSGSLSPNRSTSALIDASASRVVKAGKGDIFGVAMIELHRFGLRSGRIERWCS
jgi:hypothetical protein